MESSEEQDRFIDTSTEDLNDWLNIYRRASLRPFVVHQRGSYSPNGKRASLRPMGKRASLRPMG
jgi:hypothetical protein